MVLPTVLKRKHSLRGKQILPAVRKLKDVQDAQTIKQLARVSSTRRTENMLLDDVMVAVKDLTGENGIELLELAGKDPRDEESARLLLHFCILLANEKGQPEGQDLHDPTTSSLTSEQNTDTQDQDCVKRRKIQHSAGSDPKDTQIQQNGDLDFDKIEKRIEEMHHKSSLSSLSKRKDTLINSLSFFLSQLKNDGLLSNCTPDDLKRFLIWKDECGKTLVHKINCKILGTKDLGSCECPRRLAAGTVSVMVQNFLEIFERRGHGKIWDDKSRSGNPAAASCIKDYIKFTQEEQAAAHVVPRQAKPIFIGKVKRITGYIDKELARADISPRERYVFLRDQAWFKLQFFGGNRANDLAMLVGQEVKSLEDNSGLAIKQTYGKTLRGKKHKSHVFVIKRCKDETVCPVRGLHTYVQGCRNMGVDLANGFLFRVVLENGRVISQNVTYSVMYERLIQYLTLLGIYEGETPHSFRAGCAVTLALSGSVDSLGQMMNHVGWYGEESAEYYSRLPALVESDYVAGRLADSLGQGDFVEDQFQHYGDFGILKKAFS